MTSPIIHFRLISLWCMRNLSIVIIVIYQLHFWNMNVSRNFLFWFGLVWFGVIPVEFSDYTWVPVQESLLLGLMGPPGMPGTESGWTTWKARSRPSILFLLPQLRTNLKFCIHYCFVLSFDSTSIKQWFRWSYCTVSFSYFICMLTTGVTQIGEERRVRPGPHTC